MSTLEVKNLCKSFGHQLVIDDISFSVGDGKFLSFLGPSGCGKSTILKLITGLLSSDSGEILLNGKNIAKLPAEKRNIGMVFQNYALFPNMTVYNNVAYGLKIRHIKKDEIKKRVDGALGLVQMRGFERRPITKLSGGQQQRVALARALVIEPDILLLDEPLSALDRKIRASMQGEIRAIQKKLGITTVFVTHDQEEAMTMSDEIILLKDGKIEQRADPKTLYRNPSSIFASDFLGGANLLCGTAKSVPGGFILCGNGWSFPAAPEGLRDGMKLTAAIRSEHFILNRTPQQEACKAKITGAVFAGAVVRYSLALGGDSVEVLTLGGADGFSEGETVYLSVRPSNIRVFAKKESETE